MLVLRVRMETSSGKGKKVKRKIEECNKMKGEVEDGKKKWPSLHL